MLCCQQGWPDYFNEDFFFELILLLLHALNDVSHGYMQLAQPLLREA